jgi:hypothetical protein
VCSFPWGVRAVLGCDAELCASAASAFATELMRWLRRRAKTLLGLGNVRDAFTGAVVAIQRTDSAMRLNVHLHVLALDGVYVRDLGGALVFHPLATPNAEEVAQLARRTDVAVRRVRVPLCVDRHAGLQLHRFCDQRVAGFAVGERFSARVHRVGARHERVRVLRR